MIQGSRGLASGTEVQAYGGEVEAKLADLAVIRDTLRAALDAGCEDLVACAGSTCCPLPFVDLAALSERSS